MRKNRFSTEQIIGFIKQAEDGMSVSELGQQHGFSAASFYAGGRSMAGRKRLKRSG